MKIHLIAFSALLCFAVGCERRSNEPASSRSEAIEVWRSQMGEAEQQAKRSYALITAQEETLKRYQVLLTAQEQSIKRQQDDIDRFERILTMWESEQKQYQLYLDSLGKK